MESLREREPEVFDTGVDSEAKDMHTTVQEFYAGFQAGEVKVPKSLDGDLRVIFARARPSPPFAGRTARAHGRRGPPAAAPARLPGQLRLPLDRGRSRHPGARDRAPRRARARELKLSYPLGQRDEILVEVSGFLTTLGHELRVHGQDHRELMALAQGGRAPVTGPPGPAGLVRRAPLLPRARLALHVRVRGHGLAVMEQRFPEQGCTRWRCASTGSA
jgi:hypothetical protein